jgi:DUF971 family protein
MTQYWPLEIRLSTDKKQLQIQFDNQVTRLLSSEKLRVESPSAEVQGHSPAQKKIVTGKANVRILAIEPIGNYAVRLAFDDGHDTGIYTWDYLYQLAAG